MRATLTDLEFPKGIPGFPETREGALVRGDGPVMSLRVAGMFLPVTVPWNVMPEFGYRFDPDDVKEFGHRSDWTILCVVNLKKRTINQFAPLVVNERLGVAAQIINQVSDYSTRDPF